MTLDEIGARLVAAPDISAEAELIAGELEAELSRMWPKSPPEARTVYALAKVRFALGTLSEKSSGVGNGHDHN